jgi:hypothetical protein
MLPNYDTRESSKGYRYSELTRFPDYMRRIIDIKQMDFEATFEQMLTLLSTEPAKVYVLLLYIYFQLYIKLIF